MFYFKAVQIQLQKQISGLCIDIFAGIKEFIPHHSIFPATLGYKTQQLGLKASKYARNKSLIHVKKEK